MVSSWMFVIDKSSLEEKEKKINKIEIFTVVGLLMRNFNIPTSSGKVV